MHRRIRSIAQVLADTATIFVHADPGAAHLLGLSLDLVFGRGRCLNQIVWHYGLGGFAATRRLPRKHDVIMWYAKSDAHTFNQQRGPATPAMRARYNRQDARGRYFVQDAKRYYSRGGKPWDDVADHGAVKTAGHGAASTHRRLHTAGGGRRATDKRRSRGTDGSGGLRTVHRRRRGSGGTGTRSRGGACPGRERRARRRMRVVHLPDSSTVLFRARRVNMM